MKLVVPRAPRLSVAGTSKIQKLRSDERTDKRSVGHGREMGGSAALVTETGVGLQTWQTAEAGFYVNSLVGQVWLVQLFKNVEAQYAEASSSRGRALQTGYAWRSFTTFFEPLSPIELVRLFENLLRFANYEAYPPARSFFLSYAPLAFEHDLGGEYIGPGVWKPQAGSKRAGLRVRRTLRRWCDWLEALAHFQVHALRHPDAASRELDKLIIFLWPLLKHHHWNSGELLAILRSLTKSGQCFPCQSANQLAAYCWSALGLRCERRAKAGQIGSVAGQAMAERLFKFLPSIG